MSELEHVEAANSSWALVISAIGLYMTVTSAYLIVAFMAGVRLTTSQAGIISALYIAMASALLTALYAWVARSVYYSEKLAAIEPKASGSIIYEVPTVTTVMCIAGVLASLKFMWDIRHPKTG